MALDKPPAPTSWIATIGLASPSAQQASITSWQRRCISGLSRCTEAKSSASLDAPAAIDEAAPPPNPISIAGPPSTITASPGASGFFFTSIGRTLATPPASMIGLS